MSSSSRRWLVAVIVLVATPFFPIHRPGQRPAGSLENGRANEILAPGGMVMTGSGAPSGVAGTPSRPVEAAESPIETFNQWLVAWRRADPRERAGLATVGREMAAQRRAALKQLIETSPARALAAAIPIGLRAELPASVVAELEARIDARGNFEVMIACGAHPRIDRHVVVADRAYRASVFGRRMTQPTKFALPIHGIAIDDRFAMEETPYRILDDAEKSALGLEPGAIAVRVGEQVRAFDHPAELATFAETMMGAESQAGPQVAAATERPVAALTLPTAWSLGTKRVLWVRLDLSDDPGPAATEAEITATSTAVSAYFDAASHGQTSFVFTTLPATLRLSRPKSYYNSNPETYRDLATEAKAMAKQYDAANGNAGTYDPDRYDRWIIVVKRVDVYGWGGLGQIGGPTIWLHNTVHAGITAHELGHTQTLDHSHSWVPAGASPIGPGTHSEGGDAYDRMGSGDAQSCHFNVAQKAKIGFLDAESVATVDQSGTHRLVRHDHRDAIGPRALRIGATDLGYEYWVEHRQFGAPGSTALQDERVRQGVLLHWGPAGAAPKFTRGPGPYLLDATPRSPSGALDAAWRIGEAFVDPDAGITIKPLAAGGTAPNEYVDVQVAFGAIDGNRNPTLQAEPPVATLAARTNVVFTAQAVDPDGDAIYFRWDFGDGEVQPNTGTVTRRFPKGGTYSVRVSAHDGRGGIAAKTFSVQVADPLVAWVRRVSGAATTTLYRAVYGAGQFIVVGDNSTILRSPDGAVWSRSASPPGLNYRGVAHNGVRFVAVATRSSAAGARGGAAYSEDGVTWTAANLPADAAQLAAVTYGAGRFVAVGERGEIQVSIDGATWTAAASPITSNLRAVAYADNQFVAVGEGGRVVVSIDGNAWIDRSVASPNVLVGVARHNGAWHAATSSAEIHVSVDAQEWTRVASSGRTNITNQIVSAGGVLLAVTNGGNLHFTEDARAWSTHRVDPTFVAVLQGIAVGNGVIVAVGNGGVIHTTDVPAPAAPLLAAPTLRFDSAALQVAAGRKNVLSAGGTGFVRLELFANGVKVSERSGSAGALEWTPPGVGDYSLVVRGIDAGGASVLSTPVTVNARLRNWTWRNPLPVGVELNGATLIGDTWWIVGNAGTLLTLDRAGTFTQREFPSTQRLQSIAHAGGRTVVATRFRDDAAREDVASLWTTTDGHNWTRLINDGLTRDPMFFVMHAANRWLALSEDGWIRTSTDGVNWPRQVSESNQALRGAAYGNGLWVAVGGSGRVITSTDAVTWTARGSGVTRDLYGVAYHNGRFVATGLSGTLISSPNGIEWTQHDVSVPGHLFRVAIVDGQFVAVGDHGTILVSPQGTAWTNAAINGRFAHVRGIAGAGSEGLAMGLTGEIFRAGGAGSWNELTTGTGENRNAVVYAGGRFVAVGATEDPATRSRSAPIVFSADGRSWTRASANPDFVNLHAIAWGQNVYVATGEQGRVFTSTDARTWTTRAGPGSETLLAVAGGPAGFVAAGLQGDIGFSTDGVTWAARPSGTTRALRAATYGNGRYVVTGDNGVVLHSTDGRTWQAAASGVSAALLAVGWWESHGFIAVGSGGSILRSVDGVSWERRDAGMTDNIRAIANTPLGLVATTGAAGTILVSLDGLAWTIGTIPADRVFRGLAGSAATIAAVGENGATLTFDLEDTTPPPVIVAQPLAQTTGIGQRVTFSVSAQNAARAVFQWAKDGIAIDGANGPTFTIPAAARGHAGSYTVSITSATGTATSAPASLTLPATVDPGRLINLSILTAMASAADAFTFGVVIGGSGTAGTKPLLVRAVGPSLTPLGVSGALDDPRLEFFSGTTKIGENDNWGGAETARLVMAQVGAFAFSGPATRDAALSFVGLGSGANSARISGTGAGTVLAELYDATPSDAFTPATPRLINVSVLKDIGVGVTAGFVIGGATSRTVLVRAIGPTLAAAPFNVPGVVADPQLALFAGPTRLSANDDWGGTAALSTAFASVGAFALPNASKDAALVLELPPGSYTVEVTAGAGVTGTALIEIYEVP